MTAHVRIEAPDRRPNPDPLTVEEEPHEASAPGIWTRVWRWIRRLWK